MPPATSEGQPGSYPSDAAYPSRGIAFQAAAMITAIIVDLQEHDELRFTPAFMWVFDVQAITVLAYICDSVYCLFSALIMHVYQMRSSVPSIVTATQERMQVCMNALKEVSKVWLVAKMVHALFESILGNKMLEDKLQKAAGRRHKKCKLDVRPAQEKEDLQQKRKFDEMQLGFSNGAPVPQVSYERSRPQTPAVTPSRDIGQSAPIVSMAAPPASPHLRQSAEGFLTGFSRNNTRPPTPFNPSYSIPATPPDLFLVTRDSPHISQSLWENFQPDQLFPENTAMCLPQFGGQQNLDPLLQMPQMESPSMLPSGMQGHQHLPSRAMRGSQDAQANMHGMPEFAGMSHMQGLPQQNTPHGWSSQFPGDGQSPEDTWSNSSCGNGPIIPTTLNVEDW